MDKKTVKLQLFTYQDEDYCCFQLIKRNGDIVWHASDLAMDSPEDATLMRQMTSGYEILGIVGMVKDAAWEILPEHIVETEEEWEKIS